MRWKCGQKSNFWFRFLASLNKSTMTASSDIKCGFLSWLSAPFATAWESANKSVRCQHTHLLYPPNLVTEIQIIWAPSQPWKLYQDNRQWEWQSLQSTQSTADHQLTVVSTWYSMTAKPTINAVSGQNTVGITKSAVSSRPSTHCCIYVMPYESCQPRMLYQDKTQCAWQSLQSKQSFNSLWVSVIERGPQQVQQEHETPSPHLALFVGVQILGVSQQAQAADNKKRSVCIWRFHVVKAISHFTLVNHIEKCVGQSKDRCPISMTQCIVLMTQVYHITDTVVPYSWHRCTISMTQVYHDTSVPYQWHGYSISMTKFLWKSPK